MLIVAGVKTEVIFHIYYLTCLVQLHKREKNHEISMKYKRRTFPQHACFVYIYVIETQMIDEWLKDTK